MSYNNEKQRLYLEQIKKIIEEAGGNTTIAGQNLIKHENFGIPGFKSLLRKMHTKTGEFSYLLESLPLPPPPSSLLRRSSRSQLLLDRSQSHSSDRSRSPTKLLDKAFGKRYRKLRTTHRRRRRHRRRGTFRK